MSIGELLEMSRRIDALKTENGKLREALEFYASVNSYMTSDGRMPPAGWTDIGDDMGATAREALKGGTE